METSLTYDDVCRILGKLYLEKEHEIIILQRENLQLRDKIVTLSNERRTVNG